MKSADQNPVLLKSTAFAVRIIKLFKAVECDSAGRILGRQLLRSGTSIGANVHEAQSAQSPADFVSKMNIALKEARETDYWLHLLVAAELIPLKRLEDLKTELEEICRLLVRIIKSTKLSSVAKKNASG